MNGNGNMEPDGEQQVRSIVQRMMVDAENYRATIEKPSGTVRENLITIDDEFLHITCHVDPALRAKIQRGDFVELEKLLPWDPTCKLTNDRMELVNREGSTYFVPAADRDKINGVRKWEQAFRVYAAIYSKSNPQRASEIWQYMYTINLAANSYIWDNVACYDYTFRQLMASNPNRSWGIIYHQMWSLAMRDPIHKNNGFGAGGSGHRSDSSHSQRDNYRWKFNKNKCRFGTRCRYEHKCNYCDGYGHGAYNCTRKLRSKEKRQEKFDENRNMGGGSGDK